MNRIRARLQRQMRVPRQPSAAKFAHQRDQCIVPIHRLNRAQAKPRQFRLFQNLSYQSRERASPKFRTTSSRSLPCPIHSAFFCGMGGRPRDFILARKISSPPPQVDSGQHQFLAARSDKTLHVSHHHCLGQALRRTTRERDHAKRAAVAASLLDLQVRPRLRARRCLRFPPVQIFDERVREAIVGPNRSQRSIHRKLPRARCQQRRHRHNGGCPRSLICGNREI